VRPKIQVLVGRCPRCGASIETVPDSIQPGVEGLFCARDHEPVEYEIWDSRYLTPEEVARGD
jgi:hypothetical protein